MNIFPELLKSFDLWVPSCRRLQRTVKELCSKVYWLKVMFRLQAQDDSANSEEHAGSMHAGLGFLWPQWVLFQTLIGLPVLGLRLPVRMLCLLSRMVRDKRWHHIALNLNRAQ